MTAPPVRAMWRVLVLLLVLATCLPAQQNDCNTNGLQTAFTVPSGAGNRQAICQTNDGLLIFPANIRILANFQLPNNAGLTIFGGTNPLIKTQSFGATTATGAVAGNTATTAYLWTTAFADANYVVSCTGLTPTNVPGIVGITSLASTGFTITTVAITAAAASYANVHCIAIHN